MSLESFARLIRVARTKTEYDAACNEYRHEHGEKRLQAALETIDEIFNAEIAEHNARLCREWPKDGARRGRRVPASRASARRSFGVVE